MDHPSYRYALSRHLRGEGLDVGPGHRPFPLIDPSARVRYVDRWEPGENSNLFPELGEVTFPKPDIVANLDKDRLSEILDSSVDFVVCSHILEHLADPIGMIEDTFRVLRPGGVLLIMLPDRHRTFDQKRQPTTLEHLVAEHAAGVQQVDDAHIAEFLSNTSDWDPHDESKNSQYYDVTVPNARAEWFDLHRSRSIHAHCWAQTEFFPVLAYCVGELGMSWELIDVLLTEEGGDENIEFGFVLRRALTNGGGAQAGLVFTRSWEATYQARRDALAFGHNGKQLDGRFLPDQPKVSTAPDESPSPSSLHILGRASLDDLDPLGYLWANPDVAAVEGAPEAVAAWHLREFGWSEGRMQLFRNRLLEMGAWRQRKMERLLERSPGTELNPMAVECCGMSVTAWAVPDDRLPVPYESVSAHGYDSEVTAWVDEHPDWLFLDLGAGLRHSYRENVVYSDIAALPTVDVLCFGDSLPFDDGAFDGIICSAVLEHVPDPKAVAAEMMRVLRPDGRMIVDWPFLVPLHGYPSHYFNATELGARHTFELLGGEVETSVPPQLHPVWTLHWILREWGRALSGTALQQFREVTLAELLDEPEARNLIAREWSDLSPEFQRVIAAGTRLTVTRRGDRVQQTEGPTSRAS